jgi:periplasmic protein CpxP/Spy
MKINLKKMSAVAPAMSMLLLLAVVGFSQHGGPQQGPHPPGRGLRGGPGGPGEGILRHLSRELNLTEEQKTQIKKIAEGAEESSKALREQMRSLHEGQKDGFKEGAFDEAAVRAAAEARAKVQVELEVIHARTMSQVFAVLTAEQRAQLTERRQQFEQRRREGKGRGEAPPEGD